ncbi:PREDICTED: uncharacterized protein LOC104763807 [Camelina sativa]|uniref:Uncharacterized protein LOC104763807 n=1 Tax=Camelina sativa TaxID=90675 RepID=A0ABM0XG30_CAMSA|nr:PREDICTED: uncharacterized protein LOC104763807 [Camelina sativa]
MNGRIPNPLSPKSPIMSPSLRSVFAQVQRKSRSAGGSSRNVSSSARSNNEIPFVVWLFTRGVGLAIGYASVHFSFRELASEIVDNRQKEIKKKKESFEEERKWVSDLLASRGKSQCC